MDREMLRYRISNQNQLDVPLFQYCYIFSLLHSLDTDLIKKKEKSGNLPHAWSLAYHTMHSHHDSLTLPTSPQALPAACLLEWCVGWQRHMYEIDRSWVYAHPCNDLPFSTIHSTTSESTVTPQPPLYTWRCRLLVFKGSWYNSRDHIFGFFIEHLHAGESKPTAHLFVQVA